MLRRRRPHSQADIKALISALTTAGASWVGKGLFVDARYGLTKVGANVTAHADVRATFGLANRGLSLAAQGGSHAVLAGVGNAAKISSDGVATDLRSASHADFDMTGDLTLVYIGSNSGGLFPAAIATPANSAARFMGLDDIAGATIAFRAPDAGAPVAISDVAHDGTVRLVVITKTAGAVQVIHVPDSRFRDGKRATLGDPGDNILTFGNSAGNLNVDSYAAMWAFPGCMTGRHLQIITAWAKARHGVPDILAPAGPQLVTVGDSITDADYLGVHDDPNGWVRQLMANATFAGWSHENQGVDGKKIIDAVSGQYNGQAYDPAAPVTDVEYAVTPLYAPSRSKNIAAVLMGINDYRTSGRTPAQIIADTETLITKLQGVGFRVLYIVWTDCTNTVPGTFGADRDTIAAHFITNAVSLGIKVADTRTNARVGAAGSSADATYFVDGLHPTAAGHAELALNVVKPVLATM